jgi:hypothetical protein
MHQSLCIEEQPLEPLGLRDRLQKYQNRAARVITGATYDIGSSELLDNLNWKPLQERRNYLKSISIYKILNGHTAPSLKELAFQFNNERHDTYNLRNGDTDLAPPMPKKEFGKRCFSYNGALHWNNLLHEAKILKLEWHESLSSFKSILKQRMS